VAQRPKPLSIIIIKAVGEVGCFVKFKYKMSTKYYKFVSNVLCVA